jgi:hypothetical protein
MSAIDRLQDAIRDGDRSRVHSIIVGAANRSLAEALKCFEYAINNLPGVLDPHNEERYPIILDRFAWNEDYWDQQTSRLMSNFSKERFEHLLEVGAVVFPAKVGKREDTGYQPYEETGSFDARKIIYIGIGIAIAVPLAIWLLFKR